MNKLYVGIDVGSRGNATYLMTPDGSKHCAFTVENNTGGARLLSPSLLALCGTVTSQENLWVRTPT